MAEQSSTLEDSNRYHEEWEIFVSNQKSPYILNEKQHRVLIEASRRGVKGLIQFDSFEINPAFIVSTMRTKKWLKEEYVPKQISSGKEKDLTPEEIEKNHKRIQEIKKIHGF